jgi:hypothetical protein
MQCAVRVQDSGDECGKAAKGEMADGTAACGIHLRSKSAQEAHKAPLTLMEVFAEADLLEVEPEPVLPPTRIDVDFDYHNGGRHVLPGKHQFGRTDYRFDSPNSVLHALENRAFNRTALCGKETFAPSLIGRGNLCTECATRLGVTELEWKEGP